MRSVTRFAPLAFALIVATFILGLLVQQPHEDNYDIYADDGDDNAQRPLLHYMPKPDFGRLTPSFLKSNKDRTQEIAQLQVLKPLLESTYAVDEWRIGRKWNGPAIDRLVDCMSSNTCGKGEETVIILESLHFTNGQTGGVSGEDIWAASSLEAFRALNYTLLYTYGIMDTLMIYQNIPDLVKSVWWQATDLALCVERNETNFNETETEFARGTWQEGTKGCIRKKGFEDGIPVWKSWSFHFWGSPEHPLGNDWTLAPEDYSQWNQMEKQNRYLGYSIEARCRNQTYYPTEERHHRALALGKELAYFDRPHDTYTWGDFAEEVFLSMPTSPNATTGEERTFEAMAMAGERIEETGMGHKLNVSGYVNYGKKKMAEWNHELATSKILLGIGLPFISPSPYDSLCFGVPYINPILMWDENDPEDWTRWETQHNGLREIRPPYVYHVHKDNREELEQAVRSALENPIERYIPPNMRRAAVRERHRQIIEGNWKAAAILHVQEEYVRRGVPFPMLL